MLNDFKHQDSLLIKVLKKLQQNEEYEVMRHNSDIWKNQLPLIRPSLRTINNCLSIDSTLGIMNSRYIAI